MTASDNLLDLDALPDSPTTPSENGSIDADTEDAHPLGATPYGWCMSGDHDTAKGRGGCPVQVGTLGACPCPCHDGATAPRGYLTPPASPTE